MRYRTIEESDSTFHGITFEILVIKCILKMLKLEYLTKNQIPLTA